MPNLIRDLSNYPLSQDYDHLWELAQKQSVVCISDARKLFLTYRPDYIFTKNEFVKACQSENLSFIPPSAQNCVEFESEIGSCNGTKYIPVRMPEDAALTAGLNPGDRVRLSIGIVFVSR